MVIGLQSRDLTYVANVVEANLLTCQNDRTVGQVMNAALGRWVGLLELLKVLNTILGTDLAPRFADPRPGDVRHSQADTTRIEMFLEILSVVDFGEGLFETVEWFRIRQSRWSNIRDYHASARM